MFLVRFLIGNLWSTALICVMFGLKRILQSRASLRFQYDCWYVLVISMLLPFFPGRLWQECSQLATNSQQTMSTYNITANTAANTNYMQWTADTTQLIVEDTRGVQIEFGVLAVWVIGVLVMIGFTGAVVIGFGRFDALRKCRDMMFKPFLISAVRNLVSTSMSKYGNLGS